MSLLDDLRKQQPKPSAPVASSGKSGGGLLSELKSGGAPSLTPLPIPTSTPAPQEQKPGLLSRIGDFVKNQASFVVRNPLQAAKNVGNAVIESERGLADSIATWVGSGNYLNTQAKADKQKQEQLQIIVDKYKKEKDPKKRARLKELFRSASEDDKAFDIERDLPSINKTGNQIAAEAAGTILDLVTAGQAGSLIKEGAEGGIKQVAKGIVSKRALPSVVTGAAYGANESLKEGSTKNLARNVGIGAAAGLGGQAILETAGAAGGSVIRRLGKKGAQEAEEVVTKVGVKEATEMAPEKVAQIVNKAPEGKAVFKVPEEADRLAKQRADAKENYRTIGITSGAGKKPENAGLRIIESQFNTPQGKALAKSELDDQIAKGKIKLNDDGTITVYRGGRMVDANDLTSVSVSKEAAQEFGDVTEFKVKPEDVAVANGLDTGELLVTRNALNTEPKAKPVEQLYDEVQTERKANLENEAAAAAKPEPKPAEVARAKLDEHVENQRRQYEAAQNTRDLANERLGGDLDNIKNLIAAEEKRKTGFDVTKIPGFDEYAQALRDATGRDDLSVNDLVDYVKSVPSQAEVERLKPTVLTVPKGEVKRRSIATPEPAAPVKTEGQKAVPALAKRIQSEIEGGLDNLPNYTKANMRQQAEAAATLIEEDINRAIRIATGVEDPPKDLLRNSVWMGLKEYAKATDDVDMLRTLAKAGKQSTRYGQEIAALRGQDANDPVKKISELETARIEAKGGQEKVDKMIKSTVADIKKEISATQTKHDWGAFVESIRCK